MTRRTLLEKLDEAGFGREELKILQQIIDAEKSDLFDVLEYVFNSDIKPISREARVAATHAGKTSDYIQIISKIFSEPSGWDLLWQMFRFRF